MLFTILNNIAIPILVIIVVGFILLFFDQLLEDLGNDTIKHDHNGESTHDK